MKPRMEATVSRYIIMEASPAGKGGFYMKDEPFIELFIEFAPSDFHGAILWLPGAFSVSTAEEEREVVYVA
jgi:hypothetical protein